MNQDVKDDPVLQVPGQEPILPTQHSANIIIQIEPPWFVVRKCTFQGATQLLTIVQQWPCTLSHTWRTLKVTDNFWRMGSSLTSWIIIICNSGLVGQILPPSMIESVSRTPHPWSHTWKMLKVPDWSLWIWSDSWHHITSWYFDEATSILASYNWSYMILDLCAKFWLSRMIRGCQEPSNLKVILGGCWRFLTGVLEDGVIFNIIFCHDMWFFTCLPNFSSSKIWVCQETEIHDTWRTGSSLISWTHPEI